PKKDKKDKAPTPADELQRLQGTWQVESWDEGGQAIAGADLKKRSVFFGGNVFVFRRGDQVHQAGPVQLDPAKTPRTINLSVREGQGKDSVMLGIYELDGDALKLCFDPEGQARPTEFKADAKTGFVLVTLKKPKPAVEEAVDIVGRYRSELTEANGKVVIAEARIERRGDAYTVTYTLNDKVLFIGTALRRGDQLSMSWASAGQAGVSVYKIEAGPKLSGDFTTLGGLGITGKEVLTPWKKID
ncbi:MAG: TIGR03067 domain-containing protein, partial [Gemmataceae bacterium]|nr:TIGR03067 domain-containing protein [Gemmataceae bacterium]